MIKGIFLIRKYNINLDIILSILTTIQELY